MMRKVSAIITATVDRLCFFSILSDSIPTPPLSSFHLYYNMKYRVVSNFFCAVVYNIKEKTKSYDLVFSGAASQNRTDDLILTKDVLYRLSHSSGPNVLYYSKELPVCQALFRNFLIFSDFL